MLNFAVVVDITCACQRDNRFNPILANRQNLVETVPIWRPKPDVPPDDHKSRFFSICFDIQPKGDFKHDFCIFVFKPVETSGNKDHNKAELHAAEVKGQFCDSVGM